jgi:hypothetical protein
MNIPLKTKVKYWFEYLRLAHESNDLIVIDNLKKDTYKDWGEYLTTPFDDWWKTHSKLFKESHPLKRLSADDEVQSDMFTVQFPFTYAPTTAAKIFKEMYEREFEQRRTVKKKLKKVYGGSFSLTVDDLKVDRFRYYLLYTKKVYLPLLNTQKKVTTKDFIKKAEIEFKKVRKVKASSDKSTIPFQTSSDVYENQSRNARRYNTYSENLILNVSKGIFPGEYEKPRNPVKIVKKEKIEKTSLIKRGVAQSRYQNIKKRESVFDMYEKRNRKISKM